MTTSPRSTREALRDVLDLHRNGAMDDDALIARVVEMFSGDAESPRDAETGLPETPDWDYIEGRLSTRRDVILLLRAAVAERA